MGTWKACFDLLVYSHKKARRGDTSSFHLLCLLWPFIFLGVNYSRFSQYSSRVFTVKDPCTGLENLAKFSFCSLFYFIELFSYD